VTDQSQTEMLSTPHPGWIFQRLDLPGIVFAVTGGATAGTLLVALVLGGVPQDWSALLPALGIWFFLVLGIAVVLPLWDILYRWGWRRWWQASAFGAASGFTVTFVLVGDWSGFGRAVAEVAGFASAVSGFVVWWMAYRTRG
jgi:hypothetical protein